MEVKKKLIIGDYPGINLSKAREITREIKAQISQGIDPVAKRQEEIKSKITFEKIVREYLTKKQKELNEKYFKATKRKFEIYETYPKFCV
jgi:predicted HicB family RNase H-like nuclease